MTMERPQRRIKKTVSEAATVSEIDPIILKETAATAQGGGPNWNWEKKSYVRLFNGIEQYEFFSAVSFRLVSIAALTQAQLILRSPIARPTQPLLRRLPVLPLSG
jgi:hypothetical protein